MRRRRRAGGRVTVKKGVHPCRTLYLKSGVELHLEEGAVIKGGTKPEDYDDALPLDQIYTYSNAVPATATRKAFIFAKDAHDIAITGKGMIDSSGPAFFDPNKKFGGGWAWAKPPVPRPRSVIFLRWHCAEGFRAYDVQELLRRYRPTVHGEGKHVIAREGDAV